MIFEKELETMRRPDMEALQLERLRWSAQYCYDNVAMYRKKFDEAGFDPGRIRTLSDIRYMPFTTKTDIRDTYPYGMFAVPLKKIRRIHASSGTTGKPTVVGYTQEDLNMWSHVVARLCAAAGVTDEDIAQICFGYGLFTGALGLHNGLETLGATVIPASSGNTEKQIMLFKDLGVTTVIATPSYALYMGEVAKELGYKKEDFRLRIGLFGSEGCSNEFRSKIEDVWGLFATDNYGMSELIGPGVSGECHLRQGMHIAEDHFYPEIIRSETGETLPEGEAGELVITTLTKQGFPVLRYRTRDITRLNYEPCECGRTSVRMDKIMGRADDMLKIRGVNVFPGQIESVLMEIPEVGNSYQLVVTREEFADRLEVRVELVDASLLESYAELERLQEKVKHSLRVVLGIDAKVSLIEPKSIERGAGKAKRIIDLRK
ncbi:MAG: phenylacetate--CoA ligase [Provencibacterium sp.]|nr:phenylacetate--CoA ligase [Provencibacterium sp.]